jgi:hypothetical protein
MTRCSDIRIVKTLEECVHLIAVEDYPEEWPGVLEQIGENLESEDVQVCYSSLCALKAIIKKYQTKIGKYRAPLIEITKIAFEILERLFQKHLQIFDDSSVLIMTALTKIFLLANYVVVFNCY